MGRGIWLTWLLYLFFCQCFQRAALANSNTICMQKLLCLDGEDLTILVKSLFISKSQLWKLQIVFALCGNPKCLSSLQTFLCLIAGIMCHNWNRSGANRSTPQGWSWNGTQVLVQYLLLPLKSAEPSVNWENARVSPISGGRIYKSLCSIIVRQW